jgi:PmbA protein
MKDTTKDLCDVAARVCELARRAGAESAEATAQEGIELSVKVRLGETELLQEAGSRGLGLRVLVGGGRQAVTHTSDLRPAELERFVRDSVKLAELSEPDEMNRPADPADLARAVPDLDLYDPAVEKIDAAWALDKARIAEKAAMDSDRRISNSEGAGVDSVLGGFAYATSGGFVGGYRGSYVSLAVEPLAEDEGGKKRKGFWWTGDRFVGRLEDPEAIGREAARRTLNQLGARKVETCEAPIIFDSESGRSIVGTVFGVTNGAAFFRKSTYLVGREGTPVASALVTIVDDPLIPRAPGSRPFDGDGMATRKNVIINRGVLETVMCDLYSARKLGRASTAARAIGGTPGPTTSNLIMQKGASTKEALVKETERGLLVTSMMGFGFNPVTGDFSRGAAGFWIENGEIAFPVSEVTISANFDDLLKRIDRVADDLSMRTSTACPSFRVSSMMIAGK